MIPEHTEEEDRIAQACRPKSVTPEGQKGKLFLSILRVQETMGQHLQRCEREGILPPRDNQTALCRRERQEAERKESDDHGETGRGEGRSIKPGDEDEDHVPCARMTRKFVKRSIKKKDVLKYTRRTQEG